MTVVDTFAQSSYVISSTKAGIAATYAEVEKHRKYNDLVNYCFQPVATENTGVFVW